MFVKYISKRRVIAFGKKMFEIVRNTSKSRLLANLLKLKSIIRIGNCEGDVGSHLPISESRKTQALFVNDTPFFYKKNI